MTPAQKATLDLKALEHRNTAQDFALDLDNFYALRGKTVVDMAAKYGRSPAYIKGLLMNASQYKTTRAMTLRNTVMHDIKMQGMPGTPYSYVLRPLC